MLKILILSHPSVLKSWRKKFEEVAQNPDVKLRLIVPTSWYENFGDVVYEPEPEIRCEVFPCPIVFSGYASRFFYTSGIVTHFRDFSPHIIHLEEEPWCLCALQTLLLKKLFCPKSRLIFRTSVSVPLKLRLPFLPMLIERLLFKETDMAFPLSDSAGEILRQKGYFGPLRPFPNTVDTELFRKIDVTELKAQLGLKSKYIIGYAGRLLQMKGLDTLLHAAAKLKLDYQLLVVGSGEYKPNLISLADKLKISDNLLSPSRMGVYPRERQIWVDAVDLEEMPKYINCMDVLVLPSITTPEWVEFFGRVLVEAMACEVPVIGSDSGEIPNVVGDAGLIFREKDSGDLKDKLLYLAEETVRTELISKGRKRAISNFSVTGVAKDIYKVYKRLAPKNTYAVSGGI